MRRSNLLVQGSRLLVLLLLILSTAGLSQAQDSISEATLCFRRGGGSYCAQRPMNLGDDLTSQLQGVLEALVAGPAPAEQTEGVWSAIPEGAGLAQVGVTAARVSIYLVLPESFLKGELTPLLSDQMVEQVVKTLQPFRPQLMDDAHIQSGSDLDRLIVHILAQDPWDPAHPFRDLSYFLFEPPLERKPQGGEAKIGRTKDDDRAAQLLPGSLSGKTVYVSAGHGWYWHSGYHAWLTQRPVWQNLIEDFNNAEVINQYLLPYLHGAGADVWTVRERDLATQETIVTVDDPGHSRTGEWLEPTEPASGSSLVFPWYEAAVSSTTTATATWTFTPTETARLSVYVWYAHGPDRAPDSQYLVEHAGGITERLVDQTVHGLTWRYLGAYPFYADLPASVTLTNRSTVQGRSVAAGAVRMGGGLGSELGGGDPTSPAASGRPRWEEASRYWAQYQGAPRSVFDSSSSDVNDDVTARPRYAEWERPDGEDAVFVSWHTNGSWHHDYRGTESYLYDGTWGGIWTPGSDLLQHFMHRTLVDDIRAAWDPEWVDGGMQAANFGELRLLETMPGVLLEIGYHDNPEDTKALLDPRFAQLSARAIYRGIVRYFAHRDGSEPVFLPEPPAGLAVRNSRPGQVTLSWLPSPVDGDGPLGDAATGYRVYTSPDGFAWGDSALTSGPSHALDGLAPDQLLFVRVTAVNAGGESLPSSTLAARVAEDGRAAILLVEAFGRNDRTFATWQDDGVSIEDSADTGPSLRLFADRANRHDYAIQHGQAITQPFDSTTRTMLHISHERPAPPVALDSYSIVDWMSGKERSPQEAIPIGAMEIALSPAEQRLLAAFTRQGRSVFISGSEIGLDLVEQGYGPDFYEEVLKAFYLGSNAFKRNRGTYPHLVIPTPGGLLDGLDAFCFDDGTHGTYDADRVDSFLPHPDDARSESALLYQAGAGHAGLTWDSGGCSRLVYLAFPFETIYPAQVRQDVMSRVMDFLDDCGAPQRTYLPLLPRQQRR